MNLHVCVSLQVPSGPQGAQVVKQLLEQWPALKPLALVLKVWVWGLGSTIPQGLLMVRLVVCVWRLGLSELYNHQAMLSSLPHSLTRSAC